MAAAAQKQQQQLPVPPSIEGYLQKLKRKTNVLTGSWNKRWFFVDVMRSELCYSKSHTDKHVSASIRLDDIVSIKSFDDVSFQVESKSRNFFLKGDSKASAAGWVQKLEDYHTGRLAFEKQQRDDAFKASLKKRTTNEGASTMPTPSDDSKTTKRRSTSRKSKTEKMEVDDDTVIIPRKSTEKRKKSVKKKVPPPKSIEKQPESSSTTTTRKADWVSRFSSDEDDSDDDYKQTDVVDHDAKY